MMMSKTGRAAFLLTMSLSFGLLAFKALGDDARTLYQKGREAQIASLTLGAIELYRASLRANPDYDQPMIGLAECFFSLEEYEEALQYVLQAEKLEQDNLDLWLLEGRIRIGLNQLDQARALFQKVLQRERNNLEAQFGLAELDLARGQRGNASQKYLEALRIKPDSGQALLSLALLRQSEGNRPEADRYLELALSFHADDPRVRLAASRFALEQGDASLAERHLQTALALRPEDGNASVLLAQVHLMQQRPEQAVADIKNILDANRENPLVWYMLGLAYDGAGDTGQALAALSQAVRIAPEDEIARIAMENIALAKLPIADEARKKLAVLHLERGRMYEARNMPDRAQHEYRRCLRLDPESKEGRLGYAGIYRTLGFPVKYQKELEVLKRLGYKDAVIQDDLEIVQSQLYDSVAFQWNLDQYALERKVFTIAVTSLPEVAAEIHPFAGATLVEYMKDQLRRYDTLRVAETEPTAGSFEDAFQKARDMSSDYFLLLQFEESERSFALTLEQYLSRTGKKVVTYRTFRTGNDRIQQATALLAARFHAALPPWGNLVARRFDLGLADLGSMDELKKDDKLIVVKKGRVRLSSTEVGLAINDEDIVGDFQVSRLDERVAEGVLSKRSFFDLINPGDELVFQPAGPPEPQPKTTQEELGLLRRIYRFLGFWRK
jgi:tetratricopeptide (TPR) repeat protein